MLTPTSHRLVLSGRSPFGRGEVARNVRQDSGVQVRLKAGDAPRSDGRGMARAGGQIEPLASREINLASTFHEVEGYRACCGDQHLVVVMLMRGISVTRSVAPRGWRQALRTETRRELRSRHATFAPMTLPTPYVTAAAAAPITT